MNFFENLLGKPKNQEDQRHDFLEKDRKSASGYDKELTPQDVQEDWEQDSGRAPSWFVRPDDISSESFDIDDKITIPWQKNTENREGEEEPYELPDPDEIEDILKPLTEDQFDEEYAKQYPDQFLDFKEGVDPAHKEMTDILVTAEHEPVSIQTHTLDSVRKRINKDDRHVMSIRARRGTGKKRDKRIEEPLQNI